MTTTATSIGTGLELFDCEPTPNDLMVEVIAGLGERPKSLPCKFFYDQRGSGLFDLICQLPEYYLTRTEMRIMQNHLDAVTGRLGPRCLLIEFGSGSSLKTRTLLEKLEDPAAYVPIDISRDHLEATSRRLDEAYPDLEVLPLCADFLRDYPLPKPTRKPARRIVYFPGSTIGNFHAPQARAFLRRIADLCGPRGGLLIGVDLRKSPDILLPAYDDARGITAEFNLNLLRRINREADGNFQLDQFEHCVLWNDRMSRVEMHLRSRRDQRVCVGRHEFAICCGETIRTECSYKYTLDAFAALADDFVVDGVWIDEHRLFSVQYLVVR